MLEVRGLGCRESGVHDVSLDVRSGEILGLAGLVGAGRTELARVLFGLTPADAGTIRLRGQASRHRPSRAGPSPSGSLMSPRTAGVTASSPRCRLRPTSPSPPSAPIASAGLIDFRPRARRRRRAGPPARGEGRLDRRAGRAPFGRQPAEGGPGPLARRRADGPDPRRADAGCGRRRQGRDPPPDERAGRPRPGDPDDLVGTARGPRHERPDRRDARRHRRRACSTAPQPRRRRSWSWPWAIRPRARWPR